MKDPTTNKFFIRGAKWPYRAEHPLYGRHHKNYGKVFYQYVLNKRDLDFPKYAYTYWVEETKLDEKRKQNKVWMRQDKIDESCDSALKRKARKKWQRAFKYTKPTVSLEDFTLTIRTAWLSSQKVNGDDGVRLCPVLDIPMYMHGGVADLDNLASIHRVDNSMGYGLDNVIWVSHRANRLISDMTFDEIEKIDVFLKTN